MQSPQKLQLIIDSCWNAIMTGGISASTEKQIQDIMMTAIQQLETTKKI
jgi:hypothetical protein